MIWLRNGVVYLLSLILFVTLLFGTFAASVNSNLAKPDKLETWLSQSGLYSGVISTAVSQAQKSTNNGGSNGVSLSDVAVQQAAKAAFPPALLQKDVNVVLENNYQWLQGKIPTPNFSIDLSGAKLSFAQEVGHYVTMRLAGLPICTAAQVAALSANSDPLTITCRPSNLNAQTEGAQVTQMIATGDGFLSNPVITATTINPNGKANSQPYYTKLAKAPRVYQAATKSPFVFAGAALLCVLGIVFISSRKRKGLRRVAVVFSLVGLVLVASKFLADTALKEAEKKAFNTSSIGDIQHALMNFAKLVESHLVNLNLYVGVGFIVVAIVIIITMTLTKHRGGKTHSANTPDEGATLGVGTDTANTAQTARRRPVMDVTGPSTTKPTTAPKLPAKPVSSPPKRPRLIQ